MSVLAEFTAGPDSLAIGKIFEEFPEATVELERVIPMTDSLIPYVWVRGIGSSDAERIEASLSRVATIESISLVDRVQNHYLFRLEWEPDHESIPGAIEATSGTMVSGVGTRENWTFELRCDHHGELADFQDYCDEHGITAKLSVLHDLSTTEKETLYGLTAAQQQALVRAHERGYWRSPRETSLDELAADFGITGQAFGARLRRGIDQLVGSTLRPSTD